MMEFDWKTVATVVATSVIAAGGTVGAQSIYGSSQPQHAQAFQLVKGMTGLCIRVEEPASPAKAATVARETK